MENIESGTGCYIPSNEEKESFGSAVLFDKGEVLFPKLRPYLNKVHLAEFKGVCSTEFYSLTAKECSNKYLFIFLNSQLVVNQTSFLMSGNTLPRLQTEEVQSLLVPIPPPEVQNQIVELMDEAYKSKKDKEAKAERLLNSIDDYVLGELGIEIPKVENKMCFAVKVSELEGRFDPRFYKKEFFYFEKLLNKRKDTKLLKDFVDYIGSGSTPESRGDDYTESIEEGIPFIRVTNLKNNVVDLSNVIYIKKHIHEKTLKRTQLCADDVLLSMAGTIGLSVVVPEGIGEANINQAIAKITPKKDLVGSVYLSTVLNSSIGKVQTDRLSRPAVQANLNLDEIQNLKIPLPPPEIQNKIADEVQRRIDEAERLKQEAKQGLEEAKQKVEKMILGE